MDYLLNPLPMVLILYPIGMAKPSTLRVLKCLLLLVYVAAGLALLSVLSLLPSFFSYRPRRWPYVVFGLLSTLAFLSCAASFGITMWLFTVARDRFHAAGFAASYGPSVRASVK